MSTKRKVETKSRRLKYVKALQAADEGYHYDLQKIILRAIEEAAGKFSK